MSEPDTLAERWAVAVSQLKGRRPDWIDTMELGYYAGAQALLSLIFEAGDQANGDQDAVARCIERVQQELIAHAVAAMARSPAVH